MAQHRWPLLHHVASAVGLMFRLMPYHVRFDAARLLARASHPLIRRTEMCRSQVAMGLDTSREVALFVVLRMLTQMGCRFDVDVTHVGTPPRSGLVAMSHTTLCYVMYRDLADRGLDPVVVEQSASPLLGTTRYPRGINYLRLLQRCEETMQSGGLLCAMLDRAKASEKTVSFDLPARCLDVARPLLDMAEETGTSTWLCCARTDNRFNVIVSWFGAPAHDMLPAFKAFLRPELPSSRAITLAEGPAARTE